MSFQFYLHRIKNDEWFFRELGNTFTPEEKATLLKEYFTPVIETLNNSLVDEDELPFWLAEIYLHPSFLYSQTEILEYKNQIDKIIRFCFSNYIFKISKFFL